MYRCRCATRGFALAILVLITIAGCSGHTEQPRSIVAGTLLGKTKSDIVKCAGEPLKAISQADVTVLIYYKEAVSEESFMGSKSGFSRVRHGCRAKIALAHDRVEGIEYESVPETFGGEDHCDEIFQGCGLKP